MDLTRLNDLIVTIHNGSRISTADKHFVREDLPTIVRDKRTIESVAEYPHPAGLTVRGAPAYTFLKSHLILVAKKAFGPRGMTGHPFYDDVEQWLTIGIMRSHFEHGKPKGFYCCKTCTLAVFPLLEMDLLHYVSGKPLAREMRHRIERREGAFAKGVSGKLVDFVLSY